MQPEKLWNRTFIVLMGVNLSSALSFYLVMVKITEFAVDTYGVPQGVGGLLVSAYVIAALLTRLFFGKRIDIWGVKRALVIGSVVNTVGMALYLVPMAFALFILYKRAKFYCTLLAGLQVNTGIIKILWI